MQSMYYVVCIVLILFAVIATIFIGNSKENREGNPGYYKKSGKNWFLLTLFYILATIVLAIMVVFFIV